MFGLGLAYVPATAAGFVAGGGISAPIRDPSQALMELLILLLAPTLVVAFATLHAYAQAAKKIRSLSALGRADGRDDNLRSLCFHSGGG